MPDDDIQHGGARSGAGRPKGAVSRRTAALREAIEREGVDPAVALVRIAKAAEGREEYSLAIEAYGRVLPFLHSRPRTLADAHPEEALEFTKAMLSAKIHAAAETLESPGLADRLRRAKEAASISITVDTGIGRAPDDDDVRISLPATPAPPAAPQPRPAPAGPPPTPEPVAPPPITARPILPRPAWPERPRSRQAIMTHLGRPPIFPATRMKPIPTVSSSVATDPIS